MHACVPACLPARLPTCIVPLMVWFFFFSFNTTAESSSAGVAATTNCQASNAVGFGMISEHKFIDTVGVWG